MNDSPTQASTRPRRHNSWLVLIAAFKVGQALLFAAIGVGAIQLLHKDVGDLLARLADHLRFTPESRLVTFVLTQASILDDHLLRRIGAGGFIYSSLDLVEGIGLYFEKAWAEYLTLGITASFLPWEVYEVARRITLVRVSLLTVNALVFFYLLNLVTARQRLKRESEELSEP